MNRQDRRKQAADRRAASAGRRCGECVACCTTMGVPEIAKDPGQECPMVRPTGCAAYESRPPSCRAFECLWRSGLLEQSERPDRIGVMFTLTNPGSEFGKQAAVVREVRPHGLEDAEATIAHVAERLLVIVIRGDKREFRGPVSLVTEAKAFAAKLLPVIR